MKTTSSQLCHRIPPALKSRLQEPHWCPKCSHPGSLPALCRTSRTSPSPGPPNRLGVPSQLNYKLHSPIPTDPRGTLPYWPPCFMQARLPTGVPSRRLLKSPFQNLRMHPKGRAALAMHLRRGLSDTMHTTVHPSELRLHQPPTATAAPERKVSVHTATI